MKRENIYNKSIPKYNSVDSILDHFRIQENQLENILLEMEKNQRLAYTYYYGINRPKLDLEDISEMLQVSENVVKIYINQADDFIQRLCQNITAPIPGVVENKGRRTKNKKISFFDYFDEKDKPLVLEIIEEYKEKDSDYYEILVKACGEKYDHLVLSALTKKEKIKLNNFRAIIKNKIKNGNFSKKPGLTKKQSFFDYFEEKDKDFVLEIIEEYKEKDLDYYEVLVKEYGEKYDHLVETSPLTKEEKIKLNSFRTIIKNKIKNGNFSKKPGPTKKQSFFDYFEEKDKPLILEIIEEYKEKDLDYYEILVKACGEKYDCLVLSALTKEEKIKLNSFRTIIKNKIKNGNLPKKPGPTKKQSFFDYFDEKDKDFVLKIIEEYKEKDSDYYKVLVKTYGEKYDHLVETSPLTKKEKNQLQAFKKVIEKKLQKGTLKSGPTKKQSFFDYFEEKDKPLVLKIIEKYKEKDSDYYKVLVKTYGEKYDHLVETSPLTKEEKIKLNSFRAIIRVKSENDNFSKKTGRTKKQSFFDYFEEKDKPLVLEIIEEYKEKDSDYYKVLIKEYGEQYDSLVVPSLLNDREKNRLRDFKSAIREKLQDIKSTKNQTLQNEDFNYDLSMSYIYRRFPNLKQEKEADLIILTSFINKKKSVESISALTKFPIKKIDFILLKHLYVFSFKMPEIIEDILRRGSYTVSQIVNFNYIQTQVPFLNDKEKELLYLKMVELYQNQLSDVLKFSDKEMKHKMKTLKFKDFN